MAFQTGGEIKDTFQTGGDVATLDDGVEQRRSELIWKIFNDDIDDIVTQSNIAKELLASLDDPGDVIKQGENRMMLSALFDIPMEDAVLLEPGIIKELYGESIEKLSNAVINRNLKNDIGTALKETPLNLKIGTIGLAASTLEAIKRRAVQLAGGGVFDDAALLHQFEAITPPPRPGPETFGNTLDAENYLFDSDKMDFIRPDAFGEALARRSLEELRSPLGRPEDVQLPGAIAAEAVGLVTRIPDIGAKILRGKQKALQGEQDIATIANAPITSLNRLAVQSGVPSAGVAIGMSLLTGNPFVGLALLGETAGGAEFQNQLEQGGSVRKALFIAELTEAAEIGGEMLVFPKIVRGLQGGLSIRRGLTLIAENATQEGITGFNQTFLQVFGTETTKGTDKLLAAKKAFVAGYQAIPENAFVGGAVGGAAGAAGVGVDLVRNVISRSAMSQVVGQVEADVATEETGVAGPEPSAVAPTEAEPAPEGGQAAEAAAAKPRPSIAEQRRGEVERRLRAGEAVAPDVREEFADLVAEIEGEKPIAKPVAGEAEGGIRADIIQEQTGIKLEPGTARRVFDESKTIEQRRELIKDADFEGLITNPERLRGEKVLDILAQPPTAKPAQAGEIIVLEQIQKGKPFKPVSKKGPGLTAAERAALTKEKQEELRFKQTQGEKVGFKVGERASREKAKVAIQKLKAAQKLTEGRRKEAVELVKAFVPKENQGDFLKRVSEAKTPRDLEKLTEAVDKGIVRAEKRDAIKELNKAVKAIKPKRMLPEFAGPAQAIIDSLQLGKLKEDTIVKNSDLKEMAQQVLDSARRDEQGRAVESISTFKAQQILDELRKKTTKTFAINQLSLEALEQITDTLTALRFQNEVDTIAAQEEKATEAIRRRKLIKEQITEPPAAAKTAAGAVAKKFKLVHDNLESVTDAISGARPGTYDLWKARKGALTEFVYDVLDRGVDIQATHNRKAGQIFQQIRKDNKISTKQIISWLAPSSITAKTKELLGINIKPEIHMFRMEDARGKAADFEFTANELMSIFMHSRNSHNLAVLLNDGADRFVKGKITKGEITKQKQKIRGFTIEIIDNMIASLTDQQKAMARQVGSKLMDGFNRDAINETSVRLVGFEIAKVENYWPARRSIIRTPKGEALRPALNLIENMGILKERVGIGNPMRLLGFFETTHASNRNASTYVGLAEPLREAKAVLSTDVLAEMEDSGRRAEKDRMLKHIEKIEGQLVPVFETEIQEIVAKTIGGFAKSKLFLRAKLAPRQQISELLIAAYVDPKYMTAFRGISKKQLIEEIKLLSPQMIARILGFQFDRDIGDAFQQNDLLNYLTGDLSLIDKTGLGLRYFDTNAIVDIYRAVKAEVADKNPGIDINSDEGKALLKDRFEWVVRHTQPVWHVKDRSLIGASRDPLVRIFSMFMSQREQMVRMVNNGISDFANSEKTGQDAFRVGRTLGTVWFNLFMFSLYNFAWAVLVKKKKRDVWDFLRDSTKDIIGLPFFGKYFAEGFGISFDIVADKPVFRERFQEDPFEGVVSNILIDGLVGFTKAGKDFVTGEKYQRGPHKGELKWKIELLVAMDSVIDAFASIGGLPYYGAKELGEIAKAQIPKE